MVAVVLGVLATVATFAYLENSQGADRTPKVKILAASHEILAGTALDPAKDLEEMEIPAALNGLQARALSPDLMLSYKGQRVNRTIFPRTPVMNADLVAIADLELKGDARALSISVRGANGLGGLVRPGDFVKLFVTRPRLRGGPATPAPDPADAASATAPVGEAPALRWETIAIMPQPLKVLAVGSRLTRQRPQITATDQYENAGASQGEHTVTLEVTEEQAKSILEQTGGGQLSVTLILCPPVSEKKN